MAAWFPPATTSNRYCSFPEALVDPLASSTTEGWLVVKLRGVTTAVVVPGVATEPGPVDVIGLPTTPWIN
jgi:hypothetical protein